MTLASLQSKSKRLTLASLEAAAKAVDQASAELVDAWAKEAAKAQRWGTDVLSRLLSLTQVLVVESAEAMARRGARDGASEVSSLFPDASVVPPFVEVDVRGIASVVMGMGDRILAPAADVSAETHILAQTNQAVRILDTESFKAYNAGRLAVEGALLSRTQTQRSIQRDVKDWVFAIAVRWDASLDRRTCVICRGLDGTIRPLGMTFDGGPMPPAHPRCRCCGQFWPVAVPKR